MRPTYHNLYVSYPSDENDLSFIINNHHNAIIVAPKVEHDSVAWKEVGRAMPSLNVHGCSPVAALDFSQPGREKSLGLRVPRAHEFQDLLAPKYFHSAHYI